LRADPLLGLLSAKRKLDRSLAGKSTLNRMGLVGRTGRCHKIVYSPEAIDGMLVDPYIETHAAPPAQIVLDLDATEIPLSNGSERRYFEGWLPWTAVADRTCGRLVEFWRMRET
jgi:Transposase DDE domain group 1